MKIAIWEVKDIYENQENMVYNNIVYVYIFDNKLQKKCNNYI